MSCRMLLVGSVVLFCVRLGVAQCSTSNCREPLIDAFGTTQTPMNRELVLRKNVNEVNLVLSVTNKRGHFVNGLDKKKFSVFDNNKQQNNITFFQNQTNLPLNIAIVLDTSESVTSQFDAERNSIKDFLQDTIRHEDTAVLFAFNENIRVIAPVRYNRRELSHRLKRIKPQGDTALYDTVSAAAERLAEDSRPARRIIILVSDGQENRSRISMDGALTAALKAGAAIYSVNDGDDDITAMGKQGETVLKTLAQSTGGSYFVASEDGDIGSAFSKIRKELRSQYVLAYKPSELSSSEFHFLKVVVGDLLVRCRRGYYAK